MRDDVAVDLVSGCREQPVREHLDERRRLHAELARERESLGHGLDRATEHHVVRELHGRRAFGIRAGIERPPTDHGKQRRKLLDGVDGTGRHDAELARGGRIGPAEHGRRDEHLPRLLVQCVRLAQAIDAVGAHRHVNRAFRQRLEQAAVQDFHECLVVGQHRDDDLAPGTGLGNAVSHLGAGLLELGRLRARAVIDDQVVAVAEHSRGDRLTHAA